MKEKQLVAPFPYMGNKRKVIDEVWARLGSPAHYIEPFCGSASMLLGSPKIASLEVVNDWNGFLSNFWRAVQSDSKAVAHAADYPVSHIDFGARHEWLMTQRKKLAVNLKNPFWPGDHLVAGWWLWGACISIGGGFCEWDKESPPESRLDAGSGIHADGKIPYISGPGQGVQAIGGIPRADPGVGFQRLTKSREVVDLHPEEEMLTSSGHVAMSWLKKLQDRLDRVRILHGDWSRCLNRCYSPDSTAIFLDPPYIGFEGCYGGEIPIAKKVAEWCRRVVITEPKLRIALCGHGKNNNLQGWDVFHWDRKSSTFGSTKTAALESIWFSPACLPGLNENIKEAA
jgi:hypothetical protein